MVMPDSILIPSFQVSFFNHCWGVFHLLLAEKSSGCVACDGKTAQLVQNRSFSAVKMLPHGPVWEVNLAGDSEVYGCPPNTTSRKQEALYLVHLHVLNSVPLSGSHEPSKQKLSAAELLCWILCVSNYQQEHMHLKWLKCVDLRLGVQTSLRYCI